MTRLLRISLILLLTALGWFLPSCASQPQPATSPPVVVPPTTSPPVTASPPATTTPAVAPVYGYNVVRSYPHDRAAYTQGLVYENGVLYEGTGLTEGRSSLRRVELETGKVLQLRELPAQYFGEGIAVYGDRLAQLTWKSHVGFVYDKNSFDLTREFSYPTEGWGITYDGKRLIMSDGTATLHFLDPDTLAETGRVEVRDENGPVVRLNELEFVKGEVYANVWQTDYIVIIAPATGNVTGRIDLRGLLTPEDRTQHVDVLNGIAYDSEGDRLFVTGKLWPRLFEIVLTAMGTGGK